MNQQDILDSATQAAEWLFDRRERLEKHEEEPLTLLWLSVSEIDAIIDSFDASRQHRAARSASACYATISSIGSEGPMSRKAREAGLALRPPADAGALPSPEPGAAEAAHRTSRTRTSATTVSPELYAGWSK